MSDSYRNGSEFIEQAEAIVLDHVSDEQFGVSELAEAMNMSRSNLLRKIKKDTLLSASRFIRQIRLKKSMEMLTQTSMTVSEISYQVGFGSTSYFIKCFREYYGHPPGEAGKREAEAEAEAEAEEVRPKQHPWKIALALVLAVVIIGFIFYKSNTETKEERLEKSIAVLPFKNDSSDSTNIYFINGLMESTLNNLQKIEDFRVISRTSVEQYRNTDMSIPEIAEELGVNYLIEGSGQRMGDKVVLNIQLIEANSDSHIWGEQYNREVGDIFAMQNEVARHIATAIEAVVTPAELEQIEKKPTENMQAYDYYLQGLQALQTQTREGLEESIQLFEKALEYDQEFALAHANMSIAYYLMDVFQTEKQYTELINSHADKGLLYDPKSDVSLVAKAFYYIEVGDYRLALPHLEKALEYNPNSAIAIQTLSDLYARQIPNTAKYLEYALKGLQIDVGAKDSVAKSYLYLHLSNAFVQSGFVDESLVYINKSLDIYPQNRFSPLVKIYIQYAKDRDIRQTGDRLLNEWKKDSTRLDILQEVAKMHYFQGEYEEAFHYYEIFVNAKELYGLDIYPQEDLKIGVVYKNMGLEEQATQFFSSYADYCEKDKSIYKSASMAAKLAQEGKNDEAIEQLRLFAAQDHYQYWILLFMEKDPVIKPLLNHPEFETVMQMIEDRFWKNQEDLKSSLTEKGLL